MGRKNTLKCTEIIRKHLLPVKTYWVYMTGRTDPVYITANQVDESGDVLIFKIAYEGSAKFEESEEVVAMFKEWEFWLVSSAEVCKV